MIKQNELKVGLEVEYIPKSETGTITSWNDTFVFVDYYGTGNGIATKINDLKIKTDEII